MARQGNPAVRWSDICRRADAGFTLIEVVIALAIVALSLSLVLPRLSGLLDRLTASARRQEFEDALSELGSTARRNGRTIVLQSSDAEKKAKNGAPIDLPAGWSLAVDRPIIFRYDGMCTGGTVVLSFPGGEQRCQLSPPYCRLDAL